MFPCWIISFPPTVALKRQLSGILMQQSILSIIYHVHSSSWIQIDIWCSKILKYHWTQVVKACFRETTISNNPLNIQILMTLSITLQFVLFPHWIAVPSTWAVLFNLGAEIGFKKIKKAQRWCISRYGNPKRSHIFLKFTPLGVLNCQRLVHLSKGK